MVWRRAIGNGGGHTEDETFPSGSKEIVDSYAGESSDKAVARETGRSFLELLLLFLLTHGVQFASLKFGWNNDAKHASYAKLTGKLNFTAQQLTQLFDNR